MSTRPHRLPMLLLVTLLCGACLAALSWRGLLLHAAPDNWSWQAVPDLAVARYNHTATLLNDGRVLILGGYGLGNERLNSAEIFDPATNTWRTVAATTAWPRVFHTATLLNDGRVLIVGGGLPFGDTVDSAEIFDPATETFTPAASPGPKQGHTAVLLTDGSVLLSDGAGGQRYLPASNTWVGAGWMNHARYAPKAERLGNGQVIALGGPMSNGDLYNPATNEWSSVPPPPVGFDGRDISISVTRLGGGGVLFAGDGSSVVYTNGWSAAMGMGADRYYHATASTPSGAVATGGLAFDPEMLGLISAERFTGSAWVSLPNMNQGRYRHTATALADGRILVAGGVDRLLAPLSNAEVYGPAAPSPTASATSTYTPTPTLTPTATATATATATFTPTPPPSDRIWGRVWHDLNGNGIQDPGEPVPQDVITFDLYTDGGVYLRSAVAHPVTGEYYFNNVAPGLYDVGVVLPTLPDAAYLIAPHGQGSDPKRDNDFHLFKGTDGQGSRIYITGQIIAIGPNLPGVRRDAGAFLPGGVKAVAWFDANKDGIRNDGSGGGQHLDGRRVGIAVWPLEAGAPMLLQDTLGRAGTNDHYTANFQNALTLIPGQEYVMLIDAFEFVETLRHQGDDPALDSDTAGSYGGITSLCADPGRCQVVASVPFWVTSNQVREDMGMGLIWRGRALLNTLEVLPQSGGEASAVPLHTPYQATLMLASIHAGVQSDWLDQGGLFFRNLESDQYYIQTTAPPSYLLWSGATVNGNRVNSGVFIIDNQQPGMDWSHQKFYFYKPGASGNATPTEGGGVNTGGSARSGGQERGVALSVSAGAVTQTVTLHLTDVAASALRTATGRAPGYRPTAYGFQWDVTAGDEQQTAFDLLHPATVTLSGVSDEVDEAELLYWDDTTSAWVTPSQDCAPTHHASRITYYALRTTSFQICRSGRYGLFTPAVKIFMPMVTAGANQP